MAGEVSRAIGLAALFAAGCGDATVGLADGAAGDLARALDGALDATAPDDLTPPPMLVYVSGYAPSLSVFTLSPSGALSPLGATAFSGAPSFLAIDPTRRRLFAVDEQPSGQVAAFSLDAAGLPALVNEVSSGGNGPAHVSVDASGAWVLAANYGDGTVSVLPVGAGGRLGAATQTITAGANAHQILTDGANRHAYAPCLGADFIAQYDFDAGSGRLTPNAAPRVAAAAGAGPRHLALSPAGAFAYVIDETASAMTAYSVAATGALTPLQSLSTLPAGSTVANTGAEVALHPSGRFLYGSNRGDDSIVLYSIDAASGRLTLAAHHPTGGKTPRSFALDPTGRLLVVANQGSNQVAVFSVDAQTGALTAAGAPLPVASPTFVGIVAR